MRWRQIGCTSAPRRPRLRNAPPWHSWNGAWRSGSTRTCSFIAPDEGDARGAADGPCATSAWRSIKDEEEQLNWTPNSAGRWRRASGRRTRRSTCDSRRPIAGCCSYRSRSPRWSIDLQAIRISGDANIYDRAARKLHNDGHTITDWSPDIPRMELERFLWNDQRAGEVGPGQPLGVSGAVLLLPRGCSIARCCSPLCRPGWPPRRAHCLCHGQGCRRYQGDRPWEHQHGLLRRPQPAAPGSRPAQAGACALQPGLDTTAVVRPAEGPTPPAGRVTPPPTGAGPSSPPSPKPVRYYGGEDRPAGGPRDLGDHRGGHPAAHQPGWARSRSWRSRPRNVTGSTTRPCAR